MGTRTIIERGDYTFSLLDHNRCRALHAPPTSAGEVLCPAHFKMLQAPIGTCMDILSDTPAIQGLTSPYCGPSAAPIVL